MVYDYIIIGGGSAGAVLTNRLSEDPSNKVLVLEAGRPDYKWDFRLHMPAALTYLLTGTDYNWGYTSDPGTLYVRSQYRAATRKGSGWFELYQRYDLDSR